MPQSKKRTTTLAVARVSSEGGCTAGFRATRDAILTTVTQEKITRRMAMVIVVVDVVEVDGAGPILEVQEGIRPPMMKPRLLFQWSTTKAISLLCQAAPKTVLMRPDLVLGLRRNQLKSLKTPYRPYPEELAGQIKSSHNDLTCSAFPHALS